MNKNAGYVVVFFFCTLILSSTNAQDPATVDSLNAAIAPADPRELDTVFKALSSTLEKMPRERALLVAQQSLQQAKSKRSTLAEVYALRNLGNVYNAHGDKEEALVHFQEAVRIARQQSNDQFDLAIALFHAGQFLSQQGLLAEGLQNFLDASRIFESRKAYTYVTLCHVEATLIHYNARNYQQCIEEGYRVLSFYDKLAEADVTTATEFQRMSTYNTIGLANKGLGQYDQAMINYDKAEAIARKINNVFWIGLINGNKAVILKNLGRAEDAIASLQEDYKISKQFGVWGSAGMSVIALSEIYRNKKEYKKAQQFLDSANVILKKGGNDLAVRQGIASYWIAYAKLKAATGNFPEAYTAMSHYVALRDSLSHEQEALNLAKVKASYDLDRKQREIELLTKNNEVQQERIRGQKTLFLATLLVLILFAFLAATLIINFRRQKKIYRLVRQQRDEIETKNSALETQSIKLQENNQHIQSLNAQLEQNVAARTRELEQTNKELDTFLYHSSHDIRRPIATLLGLDQVARHVTSDEEVTLLFDKVAETARSMDSMLFKMQMVYELNKPDHPLEPTDMREVIDSMIERFREELKRHTIAIHLSVPAGLTIQSNKVLLQIVFRNLLENAIIFRRPQPGIDSFVTISVKEIGESVELSISDNGTGVKEKYIQRIFDLYFRASQASRGNGLGLYLVQKSVEKLNGEITVTSDFSVGTTFTIQLPVAP